MNQRAVVVNIVIMLIIVKDQSSCMLSSHTACCRPFFGHIHVIVECLANQGNPHCHTRDNNSLSSTHPTVAFMTTVVGEFCAFKPFSWST